MLITPDTIVGIFKAGIADGSVLKLRGEFPRLLLTGKVWADGIVLDCAEATLRDWKLTRVEGVRFQGGTFTTTGMGKAMNLLESRRVSFAAPAFLGPEHIAPGEVYVPPTGYGLWATDCEDVSVEDGKFSGFRMGLVFGRVVRFGVVRNDFSRMSGDGGDFTNCQDGLVAENSVSGLQRFDATHPDGFQFISKAGAPRCARIVVLDNLMIVQGQGIYFGDNYKDQLGHQDIAITGNVIRSAYSNAIAAARTDGVTVTDNRVSTLALAPHRASINLPDCTDVVRAGNTVAAGAGLRSADDPVVGTPVDPDVAGLRAKIAAAQAALA